MALGTIYDCCAADGCDRPYAWCELHHEKPWEVGSRSDLSSAIPLCGFQNRLIDNPAFVARVIREGPKATVTFTRRT